MVASRKSLRKASKGSRGGFLTSCADLARPKSVRRGQTPAYYISYESLEELVKDKHLAHLSDSVLDEYNEEVE